MELDTSKVYVFQHVTQDEDMYNGRRVRIAPIPEDEGPLSGPEWYWMWEADDAPGEHAIAHVDELLLTDSER